MPRSKYRIYETEYPYFMTCTVVGWLPVFTRHETVEIILNSWRYLAEHDSFSLYGYVILENHLHLLASAPELDDVIKRFKSFMARMIHDLLEERRIETLLKQFGSTNDSTKKAANTSSGRKAAIRSRSQTTK